MKYFKPLLLMTFIVVALSSCNEMRNRDLFKQTDYFVEQLETTYRSYGFSGEKRYTSDRKYRVMPIGRLINVRIEYEGSDRAYRELLDDLKSHYKNDPRVNNVYMNQLGTIMIDCRD